MRNQRTEIIKTVLKRVENVMTGACKSEIEKAPYTQTEAILRGWGGGVSLQR